MNNRARVLFVDDEKRVLNSMRGMFRRKFDLFLTTEGAVAVKIASENPIDVIVADQRMPGMSGIEVLGKVKELSPNTIRILLTGYADPSAVEGSINVGEVFRYLSKPCPPKVLRETLDLAVTATRAVSERPAPATVDLPVLDQAIQPARTETRDRCDTLTTTAEARSPVRERGIDVGVVVYTVDAYFAETAIRALSPGRSTTLATSLIKVMEALEHQQAGVLVTDYTTNGARLQRMIGALKQYLPELVTIVVSEGRDTADMVNLINHGQIFRYLLKPITPKQLRVDIDAAAIKHQDLRCNPETIKRHTVAQFPIRTETSATLDQIVDRARELQSRSVGAKGGY